MIITLTKLAFIPLGLYLIFIIAIHFEQVQSDILFLNWLSFNPAETLKFPEKYGFPENQVRNFYIETQQNRRLGIWQVIPIESYWKEISQDNKEFNDKFYDSFFTNKSTTTLIYLHGNGGNRAGIHRSFTYQEFADKNHFNVIAIDYAGFGDSEGKPTEKSVVEDSKAIWDWLIKKGASPDRLIIMGHSLGSAIATKLTEQLQSQNTLPKALMLKAPFSNAKRAILDFKLFGRFSFLGFLGKVPQFRSYITSISKFNFDSLSIINKLNLPILILHGFEDTVLPIVHGEDLFKEILNSSDCKTATITKGIPYSIEILSSECKNHLIQFAKFKHIDHNQFHRFNSVFLVIEKFLDKIN